MEEFKHLLNKIMIYTIISFELKFKDSREQKGIGPDFMFAAVATIAVIPQHSVNSYFLVIWLII